MHIASAAAPWLFYQTLFTHITVIRFLYFTSTWRVFITGRQESGFPFHSFCHWISVAKFLWPLPRKNHPPNVLCVCKLCRTFLNTIMVNARCLAMRVRVLCAGGCNRKQLRLVHVCRRGAAAYCQVAPTSQGGFEFTFILFAIVKLKTHGGTIYFTIASFRRQMKAIKKCC